GESRVPYPGRGASSRLPARAQIQRLHSISRTSDNPSLDVSYSCEELAVPGESQVEAAAQVNPVNRPKSAAASNLFKRFSPNLPRFMSFRPANGARSSPHT